MARALLPLDVLLRTMRRKWNSGDHDGAVSLARIAAPYLHARQTSRGVAPGLQSMSDKELDAVCSGAAFPRSRDDAV